MGKRIDWQYWEKLYVSGGDEVTLISLSGMEDAPAYSTLRNKAFPPKKSSEPSWKDLRKRYRDELKKQGVGGDEVKISVEEAISRTDKIIDTARMLTEHNAIAQGLIALASQGINALDGAKLKPSEIVQLSKLGIDIQRTIEGMATSRTEVDFKGMSDKELDAFIDGNA